MWLRNLASRPWQVFGGEENALPGHPLVIEPQHWTVEVLKEQLWDGISLKQYAVFEGAAYFPSFHEADRYQLRRLRLPGPASEFVCRLPSILAQPIGAVVTHNGRMHVIFEEGLKKGARA